MFDFDCSRFSIKRSLTLGKLPLSSRINDLKPPKSDSTIVMTQITCSDLAIFHDAILYIVPFSKPYTKDAIPAHIYNTTKTKNINL